MDNNKSNKLKFAEVYNKCNHNKYSEITEIKGKSELKSNCKNFFKNYGMIILIITLICLGIFIYTFRNNPISILYCFGIIILLFLLSLYNSTYKITLNDKELSIYSNLQKETIDSSRIINIYISKKKLRFMGIPFYAYTINVIYLQDNNQMMISLPTVMLSPKQVIKFFSTMSIVKIKDEEEEIEKKEKDKKTVIKTIFYVTFAVLLVASIIYGIVNGNITK